MADFNPSKKQATDFNGGYKLENGKNTVNANDINNLVEAVLYAQDINSQQDYKGLPVGGNQGDILVKQSVENYNVAWSNSLENLKSSVNQNTTNITDLQTNKQDKLISGNNIKTINGESVLGSGNLLLATQNDITTLDNKIGDINTALDTILGV